MEQKETAKQLYEAPTIEVTELKMESVILSGSKPDYDPEETARRLYAFLERRTEGQILSHSFTPGQTGELHVLTLRAHCTENIARPKEN